MNRDVQHVQPSWRGVAVGQNWMFDAAYTRVRRDMDEGVLDLILHELYWEGRMELLLHRRGEVGDES